MNTAPFEGVDARPASVAARRSFNGRTTWLAAVVVASYGLAAACSSDAGPAALAILVHALFALPGILLVRAASGAPSGWLAPLTFGPILGIALGSVALLLLWAAGGRGAWLLAAAPALVFAGLPAARRLQGRWHVQPAAPGDGWWLMLLLLVVPLVVALPFAHVGMRVEDGQVYRAYFTADYVWRRAVVLELAKGDFLPVNPFFRGDTLHYYWLPHLQSAVEYIALRQRIASLDDLLLMRSLLVDAVFIAFLYGVTRQFVRRPGAAAAAVTCAILFTSLEGLAAIWWYWRPDAPLWPELKILNIDALARWRYRAMPIDGLQRLLWYQPHHALGYALGLFGLLLIARRARPRDPIALACGGAVMGLGILTSSFGGMMFAAAAACYEAVSVLRHRDWVRGLVHAAAAALPLLLSVAGVFALEYVDRGGSVLMLGLNPQSVQELLPATFLSFGPFLALAGAGALVGLLARRGDLAPVVALVAVCVVFYFYVDVRDHQHVYVGWRVGHLLFMIGGVLIGLFFERLMESGRAARAAGTAAVLLVTLASAPTVAIDLANTQDVTNFEQGAGFLFTLLLTNDELEAFDWIQGHTRPRSVFQVDPLARDSYTWAYLPAFAGRRMSAGLPISMVPLDKYRTASAEMREIFASDPVAAHDRAERAGIHYLLVGTPERQAHPGVEQRFASVPSLLSLVYRNDTVSIYSVSITRGGP